MRDEQLVGPDGSPGLNKNFKRWPIYVLVLIYLVGGLGLAWPATRSWFIALTPLNLAGTALFLFWNDGNSRGRLFVYLLTISTLGFAIEVVGVQTGLLFGQYYYGAALGPGLFGVPFLIGLNWATLVYVATGLLAKAPMAGFQRIGLVAVLLVAYDVFLEPTAIALGFWSWDAGIVPTQNYVGWGLTAFGLAYLRYLILPKTENKYQAAVWWCQLLFFLFLSLFNGLL
jgi:putative membrane protein